MCGIYGCTRIFDSQVFQEKVDRSNFRGPDNQTIKNYFNKVVLGHNRLSIIDLDAKANQPLDYEHTSIVYNGEIYNFLEIRSNLEEKGYQFRTNSDTEIICASYIAYGRSCVERFNGMFAFVIYDQKNEILFGARDRTGQKPFYYSLANGHFEFASLSSQIAINNAVNLDEVAISQFLRWNYIPEPNSIYREIKKLRSGHSFVYDLNSGEFSDAPYWDLTTDRAIMSNSFEEAKEELRDLLIDSVERRMIADVPIGVYLSGGVDSSLISGISQSLADKPIRTFNVRFDEVEYDESPYARQVAKYLGSDHTEIHCTYQEGIDLIQNLHRYFDEPFADSTAISSLLLAKYTRKYVTVALTGDGGDENFLGYKRYDKILDRSRIFRIPRPVREAIAVGFHLSPLRYHRATRPKGFRTATAGDLFYHKMSTLDDQWILEPGKGDHRLYYDFLISDKPLLERVSDFDIKTYLVEDLNTQLDRSSMAFSLEGRSPLLDHRLIEFARQLPTEFKYHNGIKKHILKEVLYEYLPASIFDRPKSGFDMPVASWFRGMLKPYIQDMFSSDNLQKIPNIDADQVLKLTQLHIDGKENNYEMIWRLLVLINWMNNH